MSFTAEGSVSSTVYFAAPVRGGWR
jgi:hypothetical protein